MEAAAGIGIAAACVTITARIASLMNDLKTIQAKWKNSQTTVGQLITQLSTLKTASTRLSKWLESNPIDVSSAERENLQTSLFSCLSIVGEIQKHVSKVQEKKFGAIGKAGWLWSESEVKGYKDSLQLHIQSLSFHLQTILLYVEPTH